MRKLLFFAIPRLLPPVSTNSFSRLTRLWLIFLLLPILAACGDSPTPTAVIRNATSTVVAPTTAAASTTVSSNPNVIRIYFSLPIASDKDLFTTYSNAAQMAIADFTGGTNKIGNYTIEYKALDDASETTKQWDTELEKKNATAVAADPDAMFYLGPVNSGAAKISIPILSQAGIPMISPGATYPGLTKLAAGLTRADEPAIYYPGGARNFFRVVSTDDVQTPAIMEFLKSLKVQTLFLIDDSQVYGKGLADAVEGACSKYSFNCKHRTSISGTEQDYQALVGGIKDVKPDAIFFGGLAQQQAHKLIRDIRAAGINVPFMGGGAIRYDILIKEAGPASEGVYAINSGTAGDYVPEKGQDFLKRYIAKYGETGLNQSFTRQAYESMSVALTALKQAGTKDRKAITQALNNLRDFDGVLGKWSFNKDGDTTLTDFTIWQVVNGSWKAVNIVKPKLTP